MATLSAHITHKGETYTAKYHTSDDKGWQVIRNRTGKSVSISSKLFRDIIEKASAEFARKYSL